MEFPLSGEGRWEARCVGKTLAVEGFDGLYSSPLGRASETAEIIAREAHFPGPIVLVDGLMERHGGFLEGTTHAEREASNPELVERLLGLSEEERWTLLGAETDEAVLHRFERAISDICARHPAGARIVVVSHGGAMRAFLRDRFGPDVLPGTARAPNASITRLRWDDAGGPHLVELASTEHLVAGASTVE
jgi:broad specificity phosphatase PhoE